MDGGVGVNSISFRKEKQMRIFIVIVSCLGAASILRPALGWVYSRNFDVPGIDVSQNVAFFLALTLFALAVFHKTED
jgi:hypothetical protein